MLIYDPKITGSFQVNNTTVTSLAEIDTTSGSVASLNAATSSYALKTGISGSFTSLSSSLSTRLTNDESSITSLNTSTSSYLQNTTDTLTGDLTVTGTLTAQDLHVQEVTSSIVYSSGSNIFGENVSDTQTFTGSLQVSGSTNYLLGNVGIGTTSPSVRLDTRLSGTTGKVAEFHNSVGFGIGFTVESDGGVNTINAESNQALAFATNGASNERMRIDSSGNVTIGNATYGSSLGQLRIINDAASTAASISLFGYNNVVDDAGFAHIDFAMQTSGTGGNVVASIRGRAAGTSENASDLAFYTATGGTLAERMRIDSNGSVGIGVTPSNWANLYGIKALDLSTGGAIWGTSSNLELANNLYYDTSDTFKYKASGVGNFIGLNNNGIIFSNAPSGTAGSNATLAERMRINSSGTIIGTGTYSAASSIKIFEAQRSGGAVAGDWSYDDATTDMSLGTSTSHAFSLKTGDTRALTIDSSQNATFSESVVIGTSINTGIPLVVQETTADGFAIGFMRNTNSTNGNGLVLDVNSTGGSYIQDWRQGGSVKMRLLQDGNLGIGTTSPSYKTQINVTGNGETALAFMNSAVTADGNGSTNIRFVSATNAQWANASYSAYDHIWYGNGQERFTITAGGDINSNGRIKVSGGNTDQYYFEGARNGVGVTYRLYDNANNIYHDSYTSQVIRVNQIGGSSGEFVVSGGDTSFNSNNVKINGGTNYNDKSNLYLSNSRTLIQSDIVNLTANGDTSLDFQTRSGGSTASSMFIDEFRRVGIGTTSPSNLLTVWGGNIYIRGGDSKLIINNIAGAANNEDVVFQRNDSTQFSLGLNNSDHFVLYGGTTSTSHVVVKSDSNVGIGTTNPAARLHVMGGLNLDQAGQLTERTTGLEASATQNTWYTVHTFNQYELTCFFLLVGFEDDTGDGNNVTAIFVDSGSSSYGSGFAPTRLTGSTSIEAQRSGQALQIRFTHVTGGSNRQLRWSLITVTGN